MLCGSVGVKESENSNTATKEENRGRELDVEQIGIPINLFACENVFIYTYNTKLSLIFNQQTLN